MSYHQPIVILRVLGAVTGIHGRGHDHEPQIVRRTSRMSGHRRPFSVKDYGSMFLKVLSGIPVRDEVMHITHIR